MTTKTDAPAAGSLERRSKASCPQDQMRRLPVVLLGAPGEGNGLPALRRPVHHRQLPSADGKDS